jgi:hypothetical protein
VRADNCREFEEVKDFDNKLYDQCDHCSKVFKILEEWKQAPECSVEEFDNLSRYCDQCKDCSDAAHKTKTI